MDIIHYYGQTRKEAVSKAISEYGKDIYILNEAPKNLANGFVGVSIIPNEDNYFKNYEIKTVYLGNPIFDLKTR